MPKGVYNRIPQQTYPYFSKYPPNGKTLGLTPKRKKFADKYLETGNATKAALEVCDVGIRGGKKHTRTAQEFAYHALKDKTVQEYLKEFAAPAMTRIEKMSRTARNEAVRLQANRDILDRAGFKPTENTNLNIIMPRPLLAEIKSDNQLESGEIVNLIKNADDHSNP